MPETETGAVCMKCGPMGHTTENCPYNTSTPLEADSEIEKNTEVSAQEMGAFWLEKNIEGRGDQLGEEEQSLNISDLNTIQRQLESGWVGVRVEDNEIFFKQKIN